MAIGSTYCTHRDVKDVFPNMDEYDNKTPIYGWIEVTSNKYAAHNSGLVTQLFSNGEDLGPAPSAHTDLNVEGEWFYNSAEDVLYYYSASNPNDKLLEAGEEFTGLITRITKNASRYFDSRVDGGIPRDAFRDKEGNFDYLIVRTTALITAYFLINSHTPGSEQATAFLEEANFNIESINTGQTKLSYQVSGDSSMGVVREVTSPQTSSSDGGLYIVDTRGHFSGIYDLIKVIITTAGAIGTAKFDVYHGDATGLKQNKVVSGELIVGDYQSIGAGLQIRFAGKNDSSAATINDEWEIECWGQQEALDDSPGSWSNTRMTRRQV